MKQLLLVILLQIPIIGCIVEHTNFIAINEYLDPCCDFNRNTIIVLDIDNTIMMPEKLLGSEEWVMHMINKYTQPQWDMRTRFKNIAHLYFDIIHTVNFIPVELVTVNIIRQLQELGIIVVGLTARSFEVADRTIQQLQSIGINFCDAALWQEDFCHDHQIKYCYKSGVIFCDGNDKGVVLTHLFDRINYSPSKIIAIDDKEKHLQAICKAINPCINFIGIRYGHLDDRVLKFDGIAADEQLLEWIMWNWLLHPHRGII